MQIYPNCNHRGLSRASSGTISTAGKNILGSVGRVKTSSTVNTDNISQMTPSVASKASSKSIDMPLLEYYKNRDRYPNKIQKQSQFAPPSMKTIMTPIIQKSINESDRLYSSVANGNKYSTFTPRKNLDFSLPPTEALPPIYSRSKIADLVVYKNGDKTNFNDSHVYLGFSSARKNELASSMKMPKTFNEDIYKDTESVNGQYDKPNHIKS